MERAGFTVERHAKHFAPTSLDQDWLPICGHQRWLVLTHNYKQRYRALERDAAMGAGVALYFLIGKMSHAELAAHAVGMAPAMLAFRRMHEAPFIAKVYRPTVVANRVRPGRVELWLSVEEWKAAKSR